jgi:hypothetical protein
LKSGKYSYPGIGAAVGGLIGMVGVSVHWFSYSFPTDGGTVTVYLSGRVDWTGAIALAASFGAFAFGGAYVLMPDAQIRRVMGVLMAICAAFMLFMPLFGYRRVEEAVGIPTVIFSATAAAGLAVSFLGGVVASVGAMLASKEMLASTPTSTEPEPEAVRA